MLLSSLVSVCFGALTPGVRHKAARRHCLTFTLNGIWFGIDTGIVKKIARYQMLAEPRDLPRFIRGLYRHQGVMIPVVDIAARYAGKPLRPRGRTCIVLVELGVGKWRRDVGIMVDEIFGMSEFAPSELQPVPNVTHQMMETGIIEGLVRQEKDLLVVLDACRLLPDAELQELAVYMRTL
jgi:purine-binding chemotaxis protein CheW